MKNKTAKKYGRIIGLGFLGLFILGIVGFLIWASLPPQPETRALESLQSNASVTFENQNNWLVFTPAHAEPNTGLVFYPGGRVDYRAYAPLAQAIAAEGFLVVLVPMPLNFAFLGIGRGADVIQEFPQIEAWAIGGHSLGGAMAAEFVKSHPDQIDGLVLWASYPAENTDLSGLNLGVTSIYASNDGLATPDEIENSRSQLPQDAVFFEIEGGNHAGFGCYGPQNGDGTLEIAKSAQQEQIVKATVQLLISLGEQSAE